MQSNSFSYFDSPRDGNIVVGSALMIVKKKEIIDLILNQMKGINRTTLFLLLTFGISFNGIIAL